MEQRRWVWRNGWPRQVRPILHPRLVPIGPAERIDDSGRQIVEILKRNPDREPDQYGEDDIAHMRKVVAVSDDFSCAQLDD